MTNSPRPFRRAERQSDVASRNILLTGVDADELAAEALHDPLRSMADGGDGAACAQFNHGQLRGGFGQSVEPRGKSLLLRVSAMTEPRPIAEHQDVGPGQCRARSASRQWR